MSDSSTFPASSPSLIASAMTALERRATASLASIFALRMLGLFLVLPVFALEARAYPGGSDAAQVGLAMGIYGLTQGLLQIPFGLASDRFGRKPVILAGLLVFALGSFVAAWADTLGGLVAGRALQGAGAISAAVTAMLADLTRDTVRTRAMAVIGGSIALMFALSLVLAPLLTAWVGLRGLFLLTGLLALAGMAVIAWVCPAAPALPAGRPASPWRSLGLVLRHRELLRLDCGVFVLHAVQLAMWVAIPALLVQAGLARERHWWVYLPAVLASFGVMGVSLFPLEKRGHLRVAMLGAISLIAVVQLGLLAGSLGTPNLSLLALWLFVFFCGFNVLEASQPSLASRLAPDEARGAALGVYNTLQSLGFFVGGAVGGALVKAWGTQGLFAACLGLMLLWLAVAWRMRAPTNPDQQVAS